MEAVLTSIAQVLCKQQTRFFPLRLLSPSSRIVGVIILVVMVGVLDVEAAEEKFFVSYYRSSLGRIVVRKLSDLKGLRHIVCASTRTGAPPPSPSLCARFCRCCRRKEQRSPVEIGRNVLFGCSGCRVMCCTLFEAMHETCSKCFSHLTQTVESDLLTISFGGGGVPHLGFHAPCMLGLD